MAHELYYTSVPQGLQPGKQGFCIVAATKGLAGPLMERLETLSSYKELPGGISPANISHVTLSLGGRTYHVLSRVCAAGLDYSGRSNKFAHHILLEPHETPPGGPAWLARQRDFLETAWHGEPRWLAAARDVPRGDRSSPGFAHWQKAAGDAGWAGALAETFEAGRSAVLLYPPHVDPLPLLDEALGLLPPEQRWQVTFSTYAVAVPQGVACQWRCLPRDSAEGRAMKAQPGGAAVFDLGSAAGMAHGGPRVEQARSGKTPAHAVPYEYEPPTGFLPTPRTPVPTSAPIFAPPPAPMEEFLQVPSPHVSSLPPPRASRPSPPARTPAPPPMANFASPSVSEPPRRLSLAWLAMPFVLLLGLVAGGVGGYYFGLEAGKKEGQKENSGVTQRDREKEPTKPNGGNDNGGGKETDPRPTIPTETKPERPTAPSPPPSKPTKPAETSRGSMPRDTPPASTRQGGNQDTSPRNTGPAPANPGGGAGTAGAPGDAKQATGTTKREGNPDEYRRVTQHLDLREGSIRDPFKDNGQRLHAEPQRLTGFLGLPAGLYLGPPGNQLYLAQQESGQNTLLIFSIQNGGLLVSWFPQVAVGEETRNALRHGILVGEKDGKELYYAFTKPQSQPVPDGIYQLADNGRMTLEVAFDNPPGQVVLVEEVNWDGRSFKPTETQVLKKDQPQLLEHDRSQISVKAGSDQGKILLTFQVPDEVLRQLAGSPVVVSLSVCRDVGGVLVPESTLKGTWKPKAKASPPAKPLTFLQDQGRVHSLVLKYPPGKNDGLLSSGSVRVKQLMRFHSAFDKKWELYQGEAELVLKRNKERIIAFNLNGSTMNVTWLNPKAAQGEENLVLGGILEARDEKQKPMFFRFDREVTDYKAVTGPEKDFKTSTLRWEITKLPPSAQDIPLAVITFKVEIGTSTLTFEAKQAPGEVGQRVELACTVQPGQGKAPIILKGVQAWWDHQANRLVLSFQEMDPVGTSKANAGDAIKPWFEGKDIPIRVLELRLCRQVGEYLVDVADLKYKAPPPDANPRNP